MVACNDKLQLCWCLFQEIENGFVFGDVTDFGDVAAVEEDVACGEWVPVGMFGVGAGEGRNGVGI